MFGATKPLYINLRRSRDSALVRGIERSFVHSCVILFALDSFFSLCTFERKNMPVQLIPFHTIP